MPASIAAALTLNGPRTRLMASTICAGAYIQPMRTPPSPWILEKVRVMTTFCAAGDQFDARLVVVAADIFGIGRVEHQQHVLRQAGMQAADFLERQIGAGRIVGVGEEHDLRLRRDGGEDRVDVGALLASP